MRVSLHRYFPARFPIAANFAMIRDMAQENLQNQKDPKLIMSEMVQLYSETVKALGNGEIKQSEIPVDPSTRKDALRYAPSFLVAPVPAVGTRPVYTTDSIAKVLGKVKASTQHATDTLIAAAAICELQEEGYLKNEWRGLEEWKVTEVIRTANFAACIDVPNYFVQIVRFFAIAQSIRV